MTTAAAIQVAATFLWLGMVLAISFLEAPLKFRAPGITVPLGVAIGRLVFRALNAAEGVLALVVLAALVVQSDQVAAPEWILYLMLAAVLIAGAAVVRPLMDRTVTRGRISAGIPRTMLHGAYIVLEVVKVALLVGFGVLGLAG